MIRRSSSENDPPLLFRNNPHLGKIGRSFFKLGRNGMPELVKIVLSL